MRFRVPFIKPEFPSTDEIAKDYREILDSNWYTNFGPFEKQFSQEIGQYIGEGYYACTFSNATIALMSSVIAILGKGDGSKYILMPSFTFVAGADIVEWCGYKPLFVDIEIEGLHMDIKAAKEAIENRKEKQDIAGILFCNAFGVGTTNIEEWEDLARRCQVPLIIDSAAGFGSLYGKNKKVGTAGSCEVFSFHATKPFAIGEGGAVVSSNKELITKLKAIQNFGFTESGNASLLGINGKMQEFNAAIGLRRLKDFDNVLRRRQDVLMSYKEGIPEQYFVIQKNAENASLCFATVLVKDKNRDKVLEELVGSSVEAKKYYSPSIHKQQYFKKYNVNKLEVTDMVDDTVLSLPVHDSMSKDDIELIINILNRV